MEEYNKKLQEQDFKCDICQTEQSKYFRNFAVDHNHDTGKIRGLLCNGCNRGLGYYELYKEKYEDYLERRE